MTLFHLHDDLATTTGEGRLSLASAWTWLAAAFKTIHEAIVAAKMRRLQRELMFRGDLGSESPDQSFDWPRGEREIRRIAQRPMILGDKWDF